MQKKNMILKSVSAIMICTLLTKLLGFVRELVLSYYYGTSGISDAYLISQTIPSVIFEFVGAGITACFIPIYLKIKTNKNIQSANEFTNKITSLILMFSTVVIIMVEACTPFFVKIFASGFTGDTLNWGIVFTRICILSLYFSTYIFVYTAYLNANNNFFVSSFSGVVLSVCIIISIYMGAKYNVLLMSIGSCLAVGVRLLFIIPETKKYSLKSCINISWNDIYVKEFFILMLPVVIGTSINEINTLVDRTIASRVEVGAISALTYANSMMQLVNGSIVQPITTVAYPKITECIHRKNEQRAISIVTRIIGILLFLLIPLTIGIWCFGEQIIELLFSRGAFDRKALIMTSGAFKYYSLGLSFIGLREVLTRFYYANEDSKTPMINSSVGLVINIVFNITLSKMLGINGLAIATAISAFVTFMLLYINLLKNGYGRISIEKKEVIKIIFASLATMTIMSIIYRRLLETYKIAIVIVIVLSIIIYLILAKLLKIREFNEAVSYVKEIIDKRGHNEDS